MDEPDPFQEMLDAIAPVAVDQIRRAKEAYRQNPGHIAAHYVSNHEASWEWSGGPLACVPMSWWRENYDTYIHDLFPWPVVAVACLGPEMMIGRTDMPWPRPLFRGP